MPTGAKPIQFSLRTLLGILAAASVVMAIYAAVRAVLGTAVVSVFGTAVVIWFIANAAYGCLVLYGIYLWRVKDNQWRREFRRYALLGLLEPMLLVLLIPTANTALGIIGFVGGIAIACVGLAEVDQQQYRSSKLLWRLRAAVFGRATLLVVITMASLVWVIIP